MAGAVSAGAYTAGVLDFLTEALDAWYAAKAEGLAVPQHDVTLESLTGASAGGICAAISAVLLREDFAHIHDVSLSGTSNRLYESWVNRIDIRDLLATGDLIKGATVVSLLDSSIIQQIGDYALAPGAPKIPARAYLAPNLTLFLSLTNLRGVPYSLTGGAPGSVEETTFYYGDRIRFETVNGAPPAAALAHPIDFSQPGTPAWTLLKTAAIATGAFPVFLAPQILPRTTAEYATPPWEPVSSTVTLPAPNFPPGMNPAYATLNVDGGVNNNDPFNFAHDYLNSLAPPTETDGTDPCRVDRAAIDIAPFPTITPFDPDYQPAKNAGIFSAFSQLISSLISQSRFYGESLQTIMEGRAFDRFVIAPSGEPNALQCGSLDAFGGFFSRGFRAHDYLLGRRNCQQFLREYFVLPKENPIMQAGLASLDPQTRGEVEQIYSCRRPRAFTEPTNAQVTGGDNWLPIIPLCTPELVQEIPQPVRAKITGKELDEIVKLLFARFQAVANALLSEIPSFAIRIFLRPGPFLVSLLARNAIKDLLAKQFGADYQP